MIVPTTPLRSRRMGAVSAALANRSVRNAQIALAGARAVDLAQLVVVSAFVFSRGGAALVATYGVVRTLVPAVGVPMVTAIGFRHGPGVLLRITATVAAIGSVAMAAIVASGGPTLGVLAGAGIVGVALGCFRPVTNALLPRLVRSPAELMASNAATGFFDGASTLLGPVLGSLVGALVGVPALLAVTGGGMLAIAFVTGRLPRATGTTTAAGRANGPSRIADYLAGARELTANPGARLVTLLGAAQTFIRGAMNVIVVVYAIESLGTGDSGVGALYGAMGVGGLIGLPFAVIVVGRIGVHRSMAVGVATWGLPLTICALAATPRAALVLFAIIGVGNGGVDIAYDAVLQRAVADRVLTRVLGVAEAMFQGGVAAGAFAGAILLDLVDPRPALVIVGLVLPGLALLASRRLSSLDRALDRRDHDITLLREQACFATLPINALDHLAKRMARIAFAPGEIVTRAGEPNGAYVLIESGHVEIAHGASTPCSGPARALPTSPWATT